MKSNLVEMQNMKLVQEVRGNVNDTFGSCQDSS